MKALCEHTFCAPVQAALPEDETLRGAEWCEECGCIKFDGTDEWLEPDPEPS